MGRGFIYVLTNRALPGLVKIGRTDRDPSLRVAELSKATGVVAPFDLIYCREVSDSAALEKEVHSALEAMGRREVANREFFRIEVSDAINLIVNTKEYNLEAAVLSDKDDIAEGLFGLGEDCETGAEGVFEDEDAAFDLYKKASDLGHVKAKIKLLDRSYSELLIQIYERSVDPKVRAKFIADCEYVSKSGSPVGYRFLADLFGFEGHFENRDKAFIKMFALIDANRCYDEIESQEIGFCIFSYLKTIPFKSGLFISKVTISDSLIDSLKPYIVKFKQEILFSIEYFMLKEDNKLNKQQQALKRLVESLV